MDGYSRISYFIAYLLIFVALGLQVLCFIKVMTIFNKRDKSLLKSKTFKKPQNQKRKKRLGYKQLFGGDNATKATKR